MDASTDFSVIIATLGIAVFAIFLIWLILNIVGFWKQFKKAGEKGWKAIVPIYRQYVMYKISWKDDKATLIWLVAYLCQNIAGPIGVRMVLSSGDQATTVVEYFTKIFTALMHGNILITIGSIGGFIAAALSTIRNYQQSKAFGHAIGYTVGLIALPTIFNMVIGFDKSEYVGPQA